MMVQALRPGRRGGLPSVSDAGVESERERERERERETGTDTQTDRQRRRDRERDLEKRAENYMRPMRRSLSKERWAVMGREKEEEMVAGNGITSSS